MAKTEEETFINANLPIAFVEKFYEYLSKKQEEAKASGGIRKIYKKDLIYHGLKEMIDNDSFKI